MGGWVGGWVGGCVGRACVGIGRVGGGGGAGEDGSRGDCALSGACLPAPFPLPPQVLGTSEWVLGEHETFRSYSPFLGRSGFDRWLVSFVSAVDGVEDVACMRRKEVVERLRERRAYDSATMKQDKVAVLREKLRSALTPGQQLPKLIVPAHVCADYLTDSEVFKVSCALDRVHQIPTPPLPLPSTHIPSHHRTSTRLAAWSTLVSSPTR